MLTPLYTQNAPEVYYIYIHGTRGLPYSQSALPLSTHTFAYCQTKINKLDVVYGSF